MIFIAYIGRVTKERQWKRPALHSIASPAEITPVEEPEPEPEVKPLLSGWREAFDKKNNRVYYVNE